MEKSVKLLSLVYAIAMYSFGVFILKQLMMLMHTSDVASLAIMLGIGIPLIVLSLLRFMGALSLGCMILGLHCVVLGTAPYWHDLSHGIRLMSALTILMILVYVLHSIIKKEKKGK